MSSRRLNSGNSNKSSSSQRERETHSSPASTAAAGGSASNNNSSSSNTTNIVDSPVAKKSSALNNNNRISMELDDSIILECKAAYISAVKGASVDKSLTSKSDLLLALQNAGRNPTQRALSKYWTKSTEDISFDRFCQICQKEPVTTSDDLMKAFKKIDINGDGFISHAELKKVMTTKGERMTDEEVTRLIDDVDENRDGKLDYMEFSNMVLNTSRQCKETAARRYDKKRPTFTDSPKIENGSKERKGSIDGVVDDGDKQKHHQRERNTSLSREHHSVVLKDHNTSISREHNSSGSREHNSRSSKELNSNTNASTARERRNSSADRESKRSVPRSPRMSPRMSPRSAKGAKNREEQKDKFGSQTSLKSHDSRNEELPKPAPRRLSRQETPKAAVASLNLKLQTPKKLGDWRPMRRRGMFYVEDNGEISSSQYSLVITKSTSVWVGISPSPSQSTAPVSTPVDLCVFVIRSKPDKNGNSLVTFTERRDGEGSFGVACDLEPGKYHLLAYTSGCGLPVCQASSEPQKKLVRKKSGGDGDQHTLTKDFKYILTDIFNMVDTDMNGMLSREEFSTYSERTGEEKVGDDEWDVVKENAELKQGELTCKGFMQLIELEADDAGGDTDDLWVALEALGYDPSLVQNQAYPFTLEVCLENDADSTLTALPSCITTKSRALQTALKEAYISKGEPLSSENRCRAAKSSGNDKDVRIHCFETDTVVAVVIENKLTSRVTVKLDCGTSRNVKSNTKSLSEVFAIPGNSTTVAFHFVPKDETKEWFVSCVEKDLQSSA